MRIIFMGTPDFASYQLECIINAGYNVEAVLTQPDKAKGRSGKLTFSPVKEVAVSNDIKVIQPEKLRGSDAIDEIKAINPDVIVVAAYGQILPKEVLDTPQYGCINIHASLLPKYRGASPIQASIIDGEEVTGVTTMYMGEGLDTGDIIEQLEVKIEADDTGGSLFDKLAKAGGELIISTLKKLEDGTATRTPQDESLSSYAHMITKEQGHIDWTKDAYSIERLIRGFNPWPSAYTELDGKNLKLYKAEVIDDIAPYEGASEVNVGEIAFVDKKSFIVKTGSGYLKVLELQLAGKKRMECDAFLRGHKLETGTKFGE